MQFTVYTTANGVEGTFQVGQAFGDVFSFDREARLVTLYADPGTTVEANAGGRNYSGGVSICFSGQLSPDS